MVNCFICDTRHRAINRVAGVNPEEQIVRRRQELAILHRASFRRPEAQLGANARICLTCDTRIQQVIRTEHDPAAIPMQVLVQRSTTRCFICSEECNIRLEFNARIDFFVKTDIFSPEGTRCCAEHTTATGLLQLGHMENHISIRRGVVMEGNDIARWFSALQDGIRNAVKQQFDTEDYFSDIDFKNLTSLTKDQFRTLHGYCAPVNVYGAVRTVTKKDVIAFHMKLRQGLSDEFIKSLMHFSSRQAVSLAITTVRKSLMIRFVPDNLGINSNEARDREQFIQQHVTPFANELYNPEPNDPKAILYPDCTYLKVPRSRNFQVARQSYSMHKKYTLLKVGLVVAPDGYILDVHGPYFSDSRNNDASILRNDMNQDRANLRHWVREGDIFVVDRGYRDALEFLHGLELDSQMPALLRPGQRQFTTAEANQNRLITKTRWIVEARNGHLKSIFKFFRDMIPLDHCQNLGDFARIGCAIINRFHEPVHMQGADPALARQMLEIAQQQNVLQQRVQQERLHLIRGPNGDRWEEMQGVQLPGFPVLPLEYLKDKTFGTYQVYLAPSYIHDRLGRERRAEFTFQTQLFEPGLIRARLYSRFTNATHHTLYISFHEYFGGIGEAERIRPDVDPILGYYCTCKSGARTLGCCGHVASVLWYLGYARHQQNAQYPSDNLLRAVRDAAERNEDEPEIVEDE